MSFFPLPVWYLGSGLIFIFFLSTCRMARGQEETSTSQPGCKRGPTRGVSFIGSIISSLSLEELRAYYQIPDDIDVVLLEGPAENTVGDEYNAVFFTREELAVGLHFPVSSLVKQFLHFTRAPPTLIYPTSFGF